MAVKILEEKVIVYNEMSLDAFQVIELVRDDEVELGTVKRKNDIEWVKVSLSDGRDGYILGNTNVFEMSKATLIQDKVDVYEEPSIDSRIIVQYKEGDKFLLTNIISKDDKEWVKISDLEGNEGFIDGDTLVRLKDIDKKEIAKKNILYGALWCVGGLILTVATYSMASRSGTYFVFWGAVIFGGFQLLKGIYQYITS